MCTEIFLYHARKNKNICRVKQKNKLCLFLSRINLCGTRNKMGVQKEVNSMAAKKKAAKKTTKKKVTKKKTARKTTKKRKQFFFFRFFLLKTSRPSLGRVCYLCISSTRHLFAKSFFALMDALGKSVRAYFFKANFCSGLISKNSARELCGQICLRLFSKR